MASVTDLRSSEVAAAPRAVNRRRAGAAKHDAASGRRRRRPFSPLTRRILTVNILALAILVGGVFYLDQFREGLLEARIEALTTEARLIAGAIGEAAVTGPEAEPTLDPAISSQIIQRVVPAAGTRARLFTRDERLIADSRNLIAFGRQVEYATLPPPDVGIAPVRWIEEVYDAVIGWLPNRGDFPPYVERADQHAGDYPVVLAALHGFDGSAVHRLFDDRLLIVVAVPVQPFKRVLGALMLSTDSADIDGAVRAEQLGTLAVFGATVLVTAFLSFFLAGTIVRPIRRLAAAAERVRAGHGRGVEIPDFSRRQDEIGDLSLALRDMTAAVYARLDAIEAFAADVAHELKNPLTSLRSAVETLSRTDDPARQLRLIEIVLDDVRRLNRLITDISDASRLDAELTREQPERVDLADLLQAFTEILRSTGQSTLPRIEVDIETTRRPLVLGLEDRIGQVVRNLIDNAISFSPPDGAIRLGLSEKAGWVRLTVADDGPGLPPDKLAAVFDRFYTDRDAGHELGDHSGLGLSICRQIVEAHGGRIWAENRVDDAGAVVGARFIVELPVEANAD